MTLWTILRTEVLETKLQSILFKLNEFHFSTHSYLFLFKPIPQNSKGLIYKVEIEYPWSSENF